MKKKLKIIILFLFLFSAVHTKQIVKITDAFNPSQIHVTNHRMYIVDGFTLLIYSLKDFKLIKKIGEEGEGPREFKGAIYWVYFRGHQMIVNSLAKVSYFSPHNTGTGKNLAKIWGKNWDENLEIWWWVGDSW
jgi:hypothetical protein